MKDEIDVYKQEDHFSRNLYKLKVFLIKNK